MASHVLFVSERDPPSFIIGSDESDMVVLFNPSAAANPVGTPTYFQSILNHMPFTQWTEYDGSDEDEQKIIAAAQKAMEKPEG